MRRACENHWGRRSETRGAARPLPLGRIGQAHAGARRSPVGSSRPLLRFPRAETGVQRPTSKSGRA
eukprot:1677158-Alexandrium_andersonii.AAC.1